MLTPKESGPQAGHPDIQGSPPTSSDTHRPHGGGQWGLVGGDDHESTTYKINNIVDVIPQLKQRVVCLVDRVRGSEGRNL